MSSTYAGNPANVTIPGSVSVTIPSDGDAANVASVNTPGPFETLTDYQSYMLERDALSAALDTLGITLPAAGRIIESGLAQGYTVNRLVLLGMSGGTLYTSALDGHAWVTRTSGTGGVALRAIATSGTVLIAVGDTTGGHPVITRSTDGTTWALQSNALSNVGMSSVVWASSISKFVGLQSGGIPSTSPTGVTWTASSAIGGAITETTLLYGNSTIVAFDETLSGTNTQYYTSANGTAWTLRTFPFTCKNQMAWLGGSINLFYAVDDTQTLWSSPDAITWTSRQALTSTNSGLNMATNGGIAIAIVLTNPSAGGSVGAWTSVDGKAWTFRQIAMIDAGTYGPWVMASLQGQFITSNDTTTAGTRSRALYAP